MLVNFLRIHPDAKAPERNHKDPLVGDVGLDVFSVEKAVIPAKGAVEVKIGLKIAHITPGFWIKIEGRSGLAFHKGVTPFGGVIDNGYRGQIGIKLINSSDEEQVIEKGTAVAQLIIHRMVDSEISISDSLEENTVATSTERGEKGFGSSDKKKKSSTEQEESSKPKKD